MNRRSLALALSLTVLIAGASMAPCVLHAADTMTVATPTVNKDDATFVHDALMVGMTITKTSELAITRGLVGSELAFAKQTLADHSALNDELKALAKAKSVMIPTTLDTKARSLTVTWSVSATTTAATCGGWGGFCRGSGRDSHRRAQAGR